ncbi:hypothetical protein J3R74_002534 [Puniceicoccus vermicola]|uniref:Uncharacterized protein n=1 Tax=Puniceicoccus vermicola TaxID=388746 RepID=A0A7X1AUG1_9BACT|nr:hypothetical protein [Puniceicoccus vermicola]
MHSTEALEAAVSQAAPGAMIIVEPGHYTKTLRLEGYGEPDQRITIRAAEPRSVVMDAAVMLRGKCLSLEGFDFGKSSRLEFTSGQGHRLWRCRFDALKVGH